MFGTKYKTTGFLLSMHGLILSLPLLTIFVMFTGCQKETVYHDEALIEPVVKPRFKNVKAYQYQPAEKSKTIDVLSILDVVDLHYDVKAESYWLLQNNKGDFSLPVLTYFNGEDVFSWRCPDLELYGLCGLVEIPIGDQKYFVLADARDESLDRAFHRLYFVNQQSMFEAKENGQDRLLFDHMLQLTYTEKQARDGVGLAYDPRTRSLMIMANDHMGEAALYDIPIEGILSKQNVVAELMLKPSVGLVNGLDISADGQSMLISSFSKATRFARPEGATWTYAMTRDADSIIYPEGLRIGGSSFGASDDKIWLIQGRSKKPGLWLIQGR